MITRWVLSQILILDINVTLSTALYWEHCVSIKKIIITLFWNIFPRLKQPSMNGFKLLISHHLNVQLCWKCTNQMNVLKLTRILQKKMVTKAVLRKTGTTVLMNMLKNKDISVSEVTFESCNQLLIESNYSLAQTTMYMCMSHKLDLHSWWHSYGSSCMHVSSILLHIV